MGLLKCWVFAQVLIVTFCICNTYPHEPHTQHNQHPLPNLCNQQVTYDQGMKDPPKNIFADTEKDGHSVKYSNTEDFSAPTRAVVADESSSVGVLDARSNPDLIPTGLEGSGVVLSSAQDQAPCISAWIAVGPAEAKVNKQTGHIVLCCGNPRLEQFLSILYLENFMVWA